MGEIKQAKGWEYFSLNLKIYYIMNTTIMEQKYNHLNKKLKIIETILKSPNLNKITENLGIGEDKLRDDQEKMKKKSTELLEKMTKNFLILETINNRTIKILLYHD